jgi:hypothetical protein
MTFVHLNLLWAFLPFVALPVLLHLLTLHRLKTVELSTFRFLFDSYVQQRRRMQFLEALLAALRTLFLLFLVLMMARPLIKYRSALLQAAGGAGRDVIVLVDCSASMNASTAGQTAFQRAKAAAQAVAEKLGSGDRVTLVRVTSGPEEIFSRFSSDTEAIRARIEDLKTSPARANLFAALLHVFGPEAPPRTNPIVYLFTDCQASGWREVKNQGLDRVVPAGTPFVVVNVGSREAATNLAVLGDAPRRPRSVAGLPVLLHPRVVNYSRTETAEATLSVFLDEKEIARVPVTLKPGEKATRPIYLPSEPGTHRGRFEIVGKTPDSFPDDDRYFFTLTVVPKLKVVLVNGNPATDPYENEALYLKAALTAGSERHSADKKASALEPARDFARALDVHEVPEASLTAELLQDAAVVILANCGGLNDTRFGWLRDYVAHGGGLIVFPGERVKPADYNEKFFAVPGPQKELLTAVKLDPAVGDPDKPETVERLAVIDFAHPALAVFDDPDGRYLRTVRFYRRFPLVLPEKRETTWPLAEFSTGTAALVESRFGDGTVLVAAFPATTKWTNLPLKPEFVPLLLRLVSHVEHRPEVEGPSVIPAGGAAEIAVAAAWAPVEGRVTDARGNSTRLGFERSGSRWLAAYEHTAERGYYTVTVRGGPPDHLKETTLAFAVNLAPEESEVAKVDQGQVQQFLPSAQVTLVDVSGEAQQAHGPLGTQQAAEYWRWLIWLLFLIIGVEFTLATLGGHSRDGEPPATLAERIRGLSPGTWVGRMTGAAHREQPE